MCELCGTPKETEPYRDALRELACRLRAHARILDDLASGAMNPHTEEAARERVLAQRLIKELVNQWM